MPRPCSRRALPIELVHQHLTGFMLQFKSRFAHQKVIGLGLEPDSHPDTNYFEEGLQSNFDGSGHHKIQSPAELDWNCAAK